MRYFRIKSENVTLIRQAFTELAVKNGPSEGFELTYKLSAARWPCWVSKNFPINEVL